MDQEALLQKLRNYIARLKAGEYFSSVAKDFNADFRPIPPEEFLQIEKKLKEEGTPKSDLHRLCGLHIAMMTEKVQEEEDECCEGTCCCCEEGCCEPIPALWAMKEGNESILSATMAISEDMAKEENERSIQRVRQAFAFLNRLGKHYQIKETLLCPIARKHGYDRGAEAIEEEDHKILEQYDELASYVANHPSPYPKKKEILALVERMEEMVSRENYVIVPFCHSVFTPLDWEEVHEGMKKTGTAFLKCGPR